MNTVTVKINGVEYNLRGKEDVRYLFDVAAYVDTKVKEISGSNKKLSTSSAAVLTAVNIADELFKSDLDNNDLNRKNNSIEEKNLALKEEILNLKQHIDKINKERSTEIENLNKIIHDLEGKLKEADSKDELCKNLNFKLESLQNQSKDNIKTISKFNDDLNYYKNKNNELESLVAKYKDDLENKVDKNNYDSLSLSFENITTEKIKLHEENVILKDQIQELTIINETLCNEKNELSDQISIKDIELNNYISNNENQNLEEIDSLAAQLSLMENQLKETLVQKETLKSRNKEIKFQMQNYKYKVLDLEKKLINTQFNLAVEKKDKNPLLR